MASPESKGFVEKAIHYNNYIDAGTAIYGIIAGKAALVLLGLGGLIAGIGLGQWLRNRRKKG